MVALTEVDTVLNTGDGAGVRQRALEVDTVHDAHTGDGTICTFGQDLARVGDHGICDAFVADIADAYAITREAGRSACVAAALDRTGVVQLERVCAVSGPADLGAKARALIAFARINCAVRQVRDREVIGCSVGVDGAVALIARAEDVAAIDQIDAGAVDVHGAAVRLDRAEVQRVKIMLALTDVKAVADPFDDTGFGVEDRAFGRKTVRNPDTRCGALIGFGGNQTAVDNVCVRHGPFGAIVKTNTVTCAARVGRSLAAPLDRGAKAVEDRVRHHIIGFVAHLQRNPGAVVAVTCINRTASEIRDADIFGGCVGVDGAVALVAGADNVAKVADADALTFDLDRTAVGGDNPATEVVERARAVRRAEFDTVQFASNAAKVTDVCA